MTSEKKVTLDVAGIHSNEMKMSSAGSRYLDTRIGKISWQSNLSRALVERARSGERFHSPLGSSPYQMEPNISFDLSVALMPLEIYRALINQVTKYLKWPLEKLFRDLRDLQPPTLADSENGNLVCDSMTRIIRPGWARNTNGKWLVVINTPYHIQTVTEIKCR